MVSARCPRHLTGTCMRLRQAQTRAIRFGKLWDGSKVDRPTRSSSSTAIASLSVGSGQRRGARGRRGHRSSEVHRHSRPHRRAHAHHVFLGPCARNAAARPAPSASGHSVPGAGERATHARHWRDDRSRSQCGQRHGLRHARAHRRARWSVRASSRPGRASRHDRARRRIPTRCARLSKSASRQARTGSRSSARAAVSTNVDGTQTVTAEEMRAIVEAAHKAGQTRGDPLLWRHQACATPCAPAPTPSSTAPISMMKRSRRWRRSGTVWVPTIDHNRYYVDAKDEYGFPAGAEAALKDYIDRNFDSLRRAVNAGVQHRDGIRRRLLDVRPEHARAPVVRQRLGMTPAQALAISDDDSGGSFCGWRARSAGGCGYRADLVAVEGDPPLEIDAVINGVRWVMKDGKGRRSSEVALEPFEPMSFASDPSVSMRLYPCRI